MSRDVFLPLTIPVLGDGRVVVQWNVLVALQFCDLFEFFEWPITCITRFNFCQYVEAIYRTGFEFLEGNVFCWWLVVSVFATRMIRKQLHNGALSFLTS
jgi:hypothetical protein